MVLLGIHTLEWVQETSDLCSQALDISSSALPIKSEAALGDVINPPPVVRNK